MARNGVIERLSGRFITARLVRPAHGGFTCRQQQALTSASNGLPDAFSNLDPSDPIAVAGRATETDMEVASAEFSTLGYMPNPDAVKLYRDVATLKSSCEAIGLNWMEN